MQKKRFIAGAGFTLIELLVVISIIAILIGLSVFGLLGARTASRDARRKADLEQIRSALEIYKADCGTYPLNTGAGAFVLPGSTSLYGSKTSGTVCLTSTPYLSAVPVDPLPSQNYYYAANPVNGSTYRLCAAMEQEPVPTTDPSQLVSCTCGATCNYSVRNP